MLATQSSEWLLPYITLTTLKSFTEHNSVLRCNPINNDVLVVTANTNSKGRQKTARKQNYKNWRPTTITHQILMKLFLKRNKIHGISYSIGKFWFKEKIKLKSRLLNEILFHTSISHSLKCIPKSQRLWNLLRLSSYIQILSVIFRTIWRAVTKTVSPLHNTITLTLISKIQHVQKSHHISFTCKFKIKNLRTSP